MHFGKLECVYIFVQSLDVNICGHTHKYILRKTKENISAYLSYSIYIFWCSQNFIRWLMSFFFFSWRIILVIKRGHMTSTRARVCTDGLVPLFGWDKEKTYVFLSYSLCGDTQISAPWIPLTWFISLAKSWPPCSESQAVWHTPGMYFCPFCLPIW